MSREAMQMALEWVEAHADQWDGHGASPAVICAALRAALVEPKEKPWRCACGANLYIDENGAPRSKA